MNCAECEKELQRSAEEEGTPVVEDVEQAAAEASELGTPLPDSTRSFFENRMGRNFSDVRVHTGGRADRAARSISAQAFTIGSDVVFRKGEYEPTTTPGKRLLAHELTHVVQQGQVPVNGRVQRQGNSGGGGEKSAAGSSDSSSLTVEFNAFIPGALGKWFPEPPAGRAREATGVYYCEAKTEDRGFGEDGTSRIHKQGTVTAKSDGFRSASSSQRIGVSYRRCETDQGGWEWQSDRASPGGSTSAQASKCLSRFHFVGAAAYPFVPRASEINFDVAAGIVVEKLGNYVGVRVDFDGWHNAFPGYEGIAVVDGTRHVVYRYMPEDDEPGPSNLSEGIELGE